MAADVTGGADERADDGGVVVVGGGPAGLAAATALAERGVRAVILLEREPRAGGIPRHCDHPPFGLRELHRVLRGPVYAERLVARARAAGVTIRTATSVVALHPGPRLTLATPDGVAELGARRVLLCTGVRESSRIARGIGGTKPGGVLSTGALQGLVHLEKLRPFRRPIIVGSELVAFSAIGTCRKLGIRPVAMVEPGPDVLARWPCALYPRLLGIPLFVGAELVAIEGREVVSAVELRLSDGGTRRLETDGVVVSGRFRPEATLLQGSHLALDPASGGPEIDQYGRCSDPTFYAAGNLLRPAESAGWSWSEGRAVARSIALDLERGLPDPERALRVTTRGETLKFVVPQRLTARSATPALPRLQLRVTRAVRGRLVARLDDRVLGTHALAARPERRVSLPLSIVPDDARGRLELHVEDEP